MALSLSAVRQRLLSLILRTPLHGTVSRRFLLLRTVGGTDVEPPVALRYAPHEGDLVVIGRQEQTWWTHLSAEAPTSCSVRFKGRDTTVPAVLTAGEVLDESILRYLQKHPGEWTTLGVGPRASAEDVEVAARGMAVVRFTPG